MAKLSSRVAPVLVALAAAGIGVRVAAADEVATNVTGVANASLRISTRVFRLVNASAEEVADKINEMWNGEFGQSWKVTKMAVAFPESNSVMVTAPRPILEACGLAVAELDVEAPQLYIEARFVELGNVASHKLGIDWAMLDRMGGSVKIGGGYSHNRLGSGVNEYSTVSGGAEFGNTSYRITGRNGKMSQFTATLDFSQMQLALSALESTQDARTFSNPKIIVSSGKRAIVDMTTKYPNVAIAAKKTINNNNESLDLDMKMCAIPGEDKMLFAKEAFFSWGIELEVVPRVSTNGLINVQIVPTISALDTEQGENGFVTASSDTTASYSARYPIIDMQRLVTEFNMGSGSTAVIGGLSRTVETQKDNGIPYLRKIPWIGPWLFGSKVRVKEQKEIIVFVTVGLIDPHAMDKAAGLPKNAVLGRQYTNGERLEPGDRPEDVKEGVGSLDMRPLDEQALDPLATNASESVSFPASALNLFRKKE